MLRSRNIASKLHRMVVDGSDPKTVAKEASQYLRERKLDYMLPNVITYLELLLVKAKREDQCVIKSARPLAGGVVSDIAGRAGAKESEVTAEIDEALVGGYIMQHQNKIVDASIKNQLNQLHKHLLANIYSYEQ